MAMCLSRKFRLVQVSLLTWAAATGPPTCKIRDTHSRIQPASQRMLPFPMLARRRENISLPAGAKSRSATQVFSA
ncbi:hypothetical protein BDP81DRAFT_417345 [Colletotrichum phormii]|uniref:Secreted protein n=1 Tax=Colletotrichum phormii TaxID=359342 RepID=A0AAJ0A261_9PEZI|nr:uncharacterized protein BDP81DRAFT_417345 [Colletotrichum phormii]KAK1655093.1 hypothetical protein BDP81DRAFT_417345 [Colletotrichum phormii]